MHCIRESHKIRTLLSETGSSFSPVSRAKSTRHLKKDERQEILFSTAMPLRVAWNVSENGTIAVNSINAGYFRSLRNPANHQFLFPGLSVESQNVNISAGRDLIVTPVPVAEKGFGYALSVGPDQTANLGAGDRIILMTPRNPDNSSYYDDLSVALSENASATMQARQIILFGGISATYSRLLKMSAHLGFISYLLTNEAQERSPQFSCLAARWIWMLPIF